MGGGKKDRTEHPLTDNGVHYGVKGDVPVTGDTELSYVVFPAADGEIPAYHATYVSLDVEFADGTTAGFTPQEQGAAKTLWVDQWNLVRRPLGAFAGRRISRIVLRTGSPTGRVSDVGGEITGWIEVLQEQGVVRIDRPAENLAVMAFATIEGHIVHRIIYGRGADLALQSISRILSP